MLISFVIRHDNADFSNIMIRDLPGVPRAGDIIDTSQTNDNHQYMVNKVEWDIVAKPGKPLVYVYMHQHKEYL